MSYSKFAQYYDLLMNDIDYGALSEYYNNLITVHHGKKGILLDLACGTGTLSRFMHASGHDVIGVDGSHQMLSVATSKKSNNITYICQDMENLDLFGTVQNAVCSLDSLNHLKTPAALQEVFSRVSLFLEPNGLFIFDMNTIYKHSQILANNSFVYDLDEVYLVWQNFYSKKNHKVSIQLDFFIPKQNKKSDYVRTSEQFYELAYSEKVLEKMLKAAGLALVERYDKFSMNPPHQESERITYVTRKI